MKTIQVDMYAVGLGASILTQFRMTNGAVISVLADGGVGHGGYLPDAVLRGLPDAWTAFAGAEAGRRIDLMIGTHYDGDHLKGLTPIAEDNSIDIGEVWLPPVKDDNDEIPGHISDADSYLAIKFYDDDNERELLRYLEEQRRKIDELQAVEEAVVTSLSDRSEEGGELTTLPRYRIAESSERARFVEALRAGPLRTSTDYERYFERQERDAAERTGGESSHASASYDSSVPDIRDMARAVVRSRNANQLSRATSPSGIATASVARRRIMPAMLASIRKSTAASAITASHLHKLVQALKNRRTPIRPQCRYISAGRPARFVWSHAKKRFVRRARGGSAELVLTLLGPSDRLVEKHSEKLPVGSYLSALSTALGPIGLKGITESNQLSYILTIEAARQRLLISGDAGCYGFKQDDGNYWHPLLRALTPLHVVQVAHHAGRNYDFYNTLLHAGLAEQTEPAWLLVSHGVLDSSRPSDAFSEFIGNIRREGDDISLLFTAEPLADNVSDYDDLIAPVVPTDGANDEGDVRLSFDPEKERSGWVVERHAVNV